MDASYWIKKLNLSIHPEGGYYKEVYRCDEFIETNSLPKRFSRRHTFSTAIYFLLNGNQISAFHKLQSDEIWHYYTGSPLMIHILSDKGEYKISKLGLNIENGELPQIVIPHNHWFAAELLDKTSFSLMGCTVAPGFDFADFKFGTKKELIKKFPLYKDVISKLSISQKRS